MKKRSLKIVIVLIMLFMFMPTTHAAGAANGDTATLSASSFRTLNLNSGVIHSGPVYRASISGQLAVCMDPGKVASVGMCYVRTSGASSNYAKCMNLSNEDMRQACVWAETVGADKLAVFRSYYKLMNGANVATANLYAEEMLAQYNAASSGGSYYVWEPDTNCDGSPDGGGTYQRFVSGPLGGGSGGGSASDCKVITASNKNACCKVTNASQLEGYSKYCTNTSTCPDPTVHIAGNCESVSTYHDPLISDNWECIKGVDQYKEINQNSLAVGNNYCSIYCREDGYTDFPGSGFEFYAGRIFAVGSSSVIGQVWGPVCITGERECRTFYKSGSNWTEGINYTKWFNDYTSANNNVRNTWYNYQFRKSQVDAPKSYQANGCHRIVNGNVYPANAITTNTCVGGKVSGKRCVGGTWVPSVSYNCNGFPSGTAGIQLEGDRCVQKNNDYTTKGMFHYTMDGVTRYAEFCVGWGGDEYNSLNGTDSAYYGAVNYRNSLISAIKSCETLSTNYTFNPDVTFNYPDDLHYSTSNLELKESITQADISRVNNGSVATVSYYECNEIYASCRNVIQRTVGQVQNVTVNRKITSANACYSLKDDYYRYIYKINGECYTKAVEEDNLSWIKLPESYIPVSTSMIPGTYNIGLNYGNIGNIKNGEAHFDKYVGKSNNGSSLTEYWCTYNIVNSLLCSTSNCDTAAEGIDIIYRPISLNNPFPGQSGRGRATGANWCDGNGCSSNNSTVSNVITNNRGVKTDAVYKQEPIYSITLTPAIIKSIRAENANKNYDYGDFDLECASAGNGYGTGRKCISTFIHSSNYSSLFSGSCAKANASSFDSCR